MVKGEGKGRDGKKGSRQWESMQGFIQEFILGGSVSQNRGVTHG